MDKTTLKCNFINDNDYEIEIYDNKNKKRIKTYNMIIPEDVIFIIDFINKNKDKLFGNNISFENQYEYFLLRIKNKMLESIFSKRYLGMSSDVFGTTEYDVITGASAIDIVREKCVNGELSLMKFGSYLSFKYNDFFNYFIDDIFISKEKDEIYLRVVDEASRHQLYFFSSKDFNRMVLLLRSMEVF